jgi:predicted enzyme related to lactoylglutathione lyase
MADKTVRGRFVWHELMTPDTSGAHAFYSKALGWKTQPWEQDPSYSMFAAASGPLGGAVALPTGTPHWLPYIGTTDIDATVQKATSLGGRVVKEITTLPTGSKYASLTDPQGAAFAVYWSATEAQPDAPAKRGEFSWHELATSDWKGAFDFYSNLFGWERMAEHDMGPIGVYFIYGRNGRQLGGMFNKPAEMPGGPAWLGYVRVKDVNQTVAKVKSARGNLVNGPMEVPGGDWVAQFVDPYGALFAVHALAADMKPAQPAAPAAAAPAQAPAAKAEAAPAARPAAAKPAAAKAKKKSGAAKKKAVRKAAKKSAAKAAKRPARKAAKKVAKKAAKKKVTMKKRSGGKKKKTAKKPRKAK